MKILSEVWSTRDGYLQSFIRSVLGKEDKIESALNAQKWFPGWPISCCSLLADPIFLNLLDLTYSQTLFLLPANNPSPGLSADSMLGWQGRLWGSGSFIILSCHSSIYSSSQSEFWLGRKCHAFSGFQAFAHAISPSSSLKSWFYWHFLQEAYWSWPW